MQMGSYETLDGCSDARGKATQQKFFFFASSIPKYSFCIYNTKKKIYRSKSCIISECGLLMHASFMHLFFIYFIYICLPLHTCNHGMACFRMYQPIIELLLQCISIFIFFLSSSFKWRVVSRT